ncbi:LADA_0C02388g1_1 [Lachancea dasiensis]|uniref:LADA_0C02388g1_1 n=1 Tax=Lachancea dasiensis TaxID=1072105 RepID=A0A1G4IXW6_9SACH|nr:LADA_0C02388g1_1 [Lachancea dasiensis]
MNKSSDDGVRENNVDPSHQNSSWTEWIISPVNGLKLPGNNELLESRSGNVESRGSVSDSWLQNVRNRLPSLSFLQEQEAVDMNNLTDYATLSSKQIHFLEAEAQQGIMKKADTWCWFEDPTEIPEEKVTAPHSGELSVANTGSAMCPLPLVKFPISMEPQPGFHAENSLLLPTPFPQEIYHERTVLNKVSIAFKNYYNFKSEKHTYSNGKSLSDKLEGRKAVIISVVGGLPDKYAGGNIQFSARQFSIKLASVLKEQLVSKVLTFSLETPLDQKSLEVCLDECIQLLANGQSHFFNADYILLIGVYHSVPLQILLAKHLLENTHNFGLSGEPTIGIMGLDSCLGGYQFWDYNVDSNSEVNSANYQAQREKALLQGCSRIQQDILSQLSQYKDSMSAKSQQIRMALNWMFLHHPRTKLVLIGRLYDNFMTIAEKLAISLQHPNILRHIWCAGSSLGLDLKKSATFLSTDKVMSPGPLYYQEEVAVPQEREFEVCLLQNIIMAINLGHYELVPMLRLISPFFISRSFNKHTLPPTLKKQQQYELKAWIQDMEQRWKSVNPTKDGSIPAEIKNISDFFELVLYQGNKQSPGPFQLKGGIYDDHQIYWAFACDTLQTTNLLEPRAVYLCDDTTIPIHIVNNQNQYDLVWKLHDFLSYFAKIKNLPATRKATLQFSLVDYGFIPPFQFPEEVQFQKKGEDALNRVSDIWECYHRWKPPTRKLKQLQCILSFLSLYRSGQQLQIDLHRVK